MSYRLFLDDERFPVENDCAKYLMDKLFEDFDREICVIPPQYYVHSQNPVGVENIRAYMKSAINVYNGYLEGK